MILKFAISDFIEERKFKNLSQRTISSYQATLDEFQNFLVTQKEIVNVDDVAASHVKSYLMYCQQTRKNNPTSINHKLHNLKIFFNYLQNEDIISEKNNPIRKINYIKAEVNITTFTDSEIKQMLNYYKRLKRRNLTFHAYRDYIIIVILLSAGIRLGELINLKWDMIDFVNQNVILYGKKREFSSIPLPDDLKKELGEYQLFLRQHFGEVPEYVITNVKREKLSDNAVKNIFKRLKKIMGFQVNCHKFRHTYAVQMLKHGTSLFHLQRLLRHTDLNMTKRYIHLTSNDLLEQSNKYNPLNGLDL